MDQRNQKPIIDDEQFKKFVLEHRQLSDEQKKKLERAVSKMTEAEKSEIIFSIRATQVAHLLKEVRTKMADPSLTQEQKNAILEQFLGQKHKESVEDHEAKRIAEIQSHLNEAAKHESA
jgi:hypothetical protein